MSCRYCAEDVSFFNLQGQDAERYLLGCPGQRVHEQQESEDQALDRAGVDLMDDGRDIDERVAGGGAAW